MSYLSSPLVTASKSLLRLPWDPEQDVMCRLVDCRLLSINSHYNSSSIRRRWVMGHHLPWSFLRILVNIIHYFIYVMYHFVLQITQARSVDSKCLWKIHMEVYLYNLLKWKGLHGILKVWFYLPFPTLSSLLACIFCRFAICACVRVEETGCRISF